MLERFKNWVIAKKIGVVARSIDEYQELTAAIVNGIELCAEERLAIRAGIVAGLAAATNIARGGNDDLEHVVTKTYEHAVHMYGRYLKEAEHGED